MLNEIKRGFNYSIGRIISKICIALLVFVILFLVSSCKAHALVANQEPANIKSNYSNSSQTEPFNKFNNGLFWEPRDAGNELPFFNYLPCSANFSLNLDATSPCPVPHYHDVNNIDFQYGDVPGGNFTLYYTVFYYGYKYLYSFSSPLTRSWHLQTSGDFVPDTLEMQFITSPSYNVDYQCSTGICSAKPVFDQGFSNSTLNGGWGYMYHVVITNASANGNLWIKAQPVVASTNTNSGFTVGVKIDSVVSGSSSNSYAELISNDNSNTQSIINNLTGIPGKIVNGLISFFTGPLSNIEGGISGVLTGISNIPSNIWNALSGGFTSIVNKIDGVGTIVWNGLSGGITTLFTSIGNRIEGLFIPSNFTWTGLWNNQLKPLYDRFVAKLGALGLPFDLLQGFYDTISSFETQDSYIIDIPEIKDPIYNITIIHSNSLNLSNLVSSGVFHTIYELYLVFVDCIAIFGVASFSYRKFQDIFEG